MATNQKYKVKLTDEQYSELNRIIVSASKKVTMETKARAKTLKYLYEGLPPEEVAHKSKLHRQTVYDLRKRFCTEGFEVALHRKKREIPPVEPKVTGELEARIIALACSDVPQGSAKWTLRLLADKCVELHYIDALSHMTVSRLLKKHNLSLI